jgi:tetratricopeptide (TPR) repeat protein
MIDSPGSVEHQLAQARDRFALQDYYGAIHICSRVLDAGCAFPDVHHLMGVAFALLGQPDRALAAFDAALALNPRYLEATIHRALALAALGRVDEVAPALRHAAEITPPPVAGFPAAVASQLANRHADLGRAYAEAGARDRAIAEYRRALELGPAFHDLRYQLGRLLLESGQVLEARDVLGALVAAHPHFVDAQAALGLSCYLSGDAAEAQRVWRDCLARRPASARIEAYLAMVERARA